MPDAAPSSGRPGRGLRHDEGQHHLVHLYGRVFAADPFDPRCGALRWFHRRLDRASVDRARQLGLSGQHPIPADPSQHRVATLLPSPDQVITAAQRIPGAIQEGLADALDGDSATSTVPTSTETDSDDPPEDKPLTDVVRDSEKAVPGKDPEPVGTDDNSENEALTETESNEQAPTGTESNEQAPTETEPNDYTGTETDADDPADSGDESEDDESRDAEAA
jgi:hypothetical protein